MFATNSDLLILISLQPNVVSLRYFKLTHSLKLNNLSLKYHMFIRLQRHGQFEFVAKTQFLSKKVTDPLALHQWAVGTGKSAIEPESG